MGRKRHLCGSMDCGVQKTREIFPSVNYTGFKHPAPNHPNIIQHYYFGLDMYTILDS